MSSRYRLALTAALAIAGLAPVAIAQDAAKPTADEQAIHDSAVKFVDAYNAKNAAAIAELFLPKARVEEADGTIVEGRDAIQAAFAAVFEEEPSAAISVTMDSLTFLTPEVAVELGTTESFPDGDTLTSRSKYLAAHLKKDGKWGMVSVRTFGREVVSNYEYLRQLEWLVGDWVDQGVDGEVKSKITWDEGRNFLIQDFSVERDGEVAIKGSQRIGWDPQAKQFRGWIFDSQGGFGNATWMPVEDGWLVKSSGVGSSGENASATRLFIPMGDRIVVRTSERIADGETSPDLEFTMVRQAPLPATAASN